MCGATAANPVMGLAAFLFRPCRRKQFKMDVRLYVGNLAKSTTEDELNTLFAQAGSVASVDLVRDRISGESRGFAFVTMSEQTEADKAIGMFNAYSLADRELKVNIAKPKVERAR